MEKKTALIIGHPGHELRAYTYIKKYKPDVFILTDGSGSSNASRIHQSIKLLDSIGAKFQDSIKVFTDKELYNIVLEQDLSEISIYMDSLKNIIIKNNYDVIVGDALEGFNPTHDICRYLINGILSAISSDDSSKAILNYDFVLDSAPNNISIDDNAGGLSLRLSDEEFYMKMEAAMNYPELKYEVETAVNKYGKEVFLWESFGKVSDLNQISNWNTSKPYYEQFGEKRVKEGAYSTVITFEKHIKPIAELCLGNNINFL
ncbi:hypothetical protein BC749_1011137 [Flavobacterium araucananum]|uniref:LmbE family protein n=1 Tax=Flavobacterium araucananum TaxID=946678 RepID=A0A227NZI5_9FLAO|nr:hypothetical protein [Flavobacterium araucananum]OXG03077.1 hypothetical protein B0A64_17940 [Flavobacterium araucananum]PWK03050.1 hypothetical protein BC749_1011137 [Flavobacterium araucananum]